jgi:pantoate--beta-alanine ligase
MKSVSTVAELRELLAPLRNKTIGFVPTMGALHEGHISLVERARKECDVVVASVFVNPTQFNDKNDLRNYPRTPEADAAMLDAAGVDYVLFPSVEEIYPEPDTRQFDFGLIDKVMEGATRPGHFNGVAQVVSRLFAIVEPTKSYFGEKDFQQIAVIRAMVAQLGLSVEIIDCPIIRDTDGLARSSRNLLLTPEHRVAAPHIYEVLSAAQAKVGEMSPRELEAWVVGEIDQNPLLKTIYFHAVDAATMQQVESWAESERVQGCVAVQAGEIRLIDNIKLR